MATSPYPNAELWLMSVRRRARADFHRKLDALLAAAEQEERITASLPVENSSTH